MEKFHNPKYKSLAQYNRSHMTPEERHLWYDYLKKLPYTIQRQKPIGEYIVDFYCAQAKLVIEIDGSQHGTPEGIEADRIRDAYMASIGLRVIRYPNYMVRRNFYGVCSDILKHINPDDQVNKFR